MSTTIKLRRGTMLPSSGLEIGEPLFITSSGSEALHIAKSSTQTVKIGPVRKTATDDTLQDYEYYPTVVNSTLGIVDDVKISEHFLISKYYNNNTFDLNIGDLLDSGDSTHHQFKGALRLYYGNSTVDSIICSGADTTNYTPLVDGTLLSTGNTNIVTTQVADIPSTWGQVKYNTVDKKLYFVDTTASGNVVSLSKPSLVDVSSTPPERIYMRLLGTTQTFSNNQTVALTDTFVTHNYSAKGGLSYSYGELVVESAAGLLPNETTHYNDSFNVSTGELNTHAYINLIGMYVAPNTNTPIYSSNLLYSSTVTTDGALYYNQLPPVDGTLLSTGHLYTSAQSGTACPIKATGSGSNMKLYADVQLQNYTPGDDITITNNSISAVNQLPFIEASVSFDSVNNVIEYQQETSNGNIRRNYSKFVVDQDSVGVTTLQAPIYFYIDVLNVENFFIVHDDILKLTLLKPKIFYRNTEISRYYNNYSLTINSQQSLPGDVYRFEVIVNKTKKDELYAVLTITPIYYD